MVLITHSIITASNQSDGVAFLLSFAAAVLSARSLMYEGL